MIKSVPLDRFATGFTNQTDQLLASHTLRRGSAGIVVNLLLDDRAVEVVGTETQRDLSDFWREHLPVGFNVRKIIQHQAADGNLLDIEHACGLWQMFERRVIGMESQRDEGL